MNEERVNNEESSYYDSITKISKLKQEMAQAERVKDLRGLLDDNDEALPHHNEEIQIDVPDSMIESNPNISKE